MERIPIGIVGVGMVGTPLARYLSEIRGYECGRDLFLYDIDPAKGCADDINRGEVVFICVPTPRAPDGSCNLSAVASAFGTLNGEKAVVVKSTVPPGTTELFQERYPRLKVLFNPENLTERFAWEDFIRPDTQIVGFTAQSKDVAHIVLALLPKAPFMSPWGIGTHTRIGITATEAEIIKYARNVHFYRKVNFANTLARLAERHGVDYENVRRGMAADHRIGDSHLDVSYGGYRGVGGYCLPKDMDAFIQHLDAAGLRTCADLLKRDREFNASVLAEQGLSIEDVSAHDHHLQEKFRRRENANREA